MDLQKTANRVLDAVARIAPETRYEERTWTEAGTVGTNVMLRKELDGELCEFCDVVFEMRRVWIEVKHSWTWGTFRKPHVPNGVYRKHLLGDSKNTALHDARDKLPVHSAKQGVEIVGLLVIALDSEQLRHSLDDFASLERLAGMDTAPWQRYSRPRWLSEEPGYESIGVQPFLWLRPAGQA